jgi:hypothetical protein
MKTLTFLLITLFASTASGADLLVKKGESVQAAINRAAPGDNLLLEPGVVFTGEIRLPAKPLGLPITIRTAASLASRRIDPLDIAQMPVLTSGVNAAVIVCEEFCDGWNLVGLIVRPTTTFLSGEGIIIEGGKNINIDRVFEVSAGGDIKRGIRVNGENITITRSFISGIWVSGQDSQCIAGWDRVKNHKIIDNYLSCASENIIYGGADSFSEARMPRDILIENNLFTKDLAWKGLPRQVKNLFELKAAINVVIRGNVFENNWADAQAGRAILFTPRNQDGRAPWSRLENILFEGNIVRNVPIAIAILGYDNDQPSGQTTNLVLRENHITADNIGFLVMGQNNRVEIYKNTVVLPDSHPVLSLTNEMIWPAGSTKRMSTKSVESLVFAENTSPGSYIHSPTANNAAALKIMTTEYFTTLPSTTPTAPPSPAGLKIIR